MVSETRYTIPIYTYLYLLCANRFYYIQTLPMEQAACCAHTISVHPIVGHNLHKQCKLGIIFNIVLIVHYAMDNSTELCQSLP